MYGILAMGWRNSARHWHRYEITYMLLGGLATPLVVSVHSVVGSDFAISIVPGWHETVFPPYFVAGAIFSGFAMVLILAIPLRLSYQLQALITRDHLEVMGKLLLATSLLTSYGYLSEQTLTYYGGDIFDVHVYWYRLTNFDNTHGSSGFSSPAIRSCRRCSGCAACGAINSCCLRFPSIALVGMWLERYMIITSSLSEIFFRRRLGFSSRRCGTC